MHVAASSGTKPSAFKKRKLQSIDDSRFFNGKKESRRLDVKKSGSKAQVSPEVERKQKDKGKEPAVSTKKQTRASKDKDALPVLPKTFKIVAGSYEKLLYGLEASFAEDDSPGPSAQKLQLKPIFIFPAHVSCVKAVAASPSGGKWLATGSSDEIIKVWDLRRRKEIGGLLHHEGSITYLTFPSRSHLMSASEDGTLCLFHARDWSVLRTLKGHKGRVNCVGVHPSGKLALSVGKDRTLRMWDLMRGKGSASTKLGKEGEVVCWSPSGARFAVQAGTSIDLFSTNMTLEHAITHTSRVHNVKFFSPKDFTTDFLLVAAEDKKVTIYELSSDIDTPPKIIAELVGHGNRVKAMDLITIAIPPYSENKSATYAATASSDGFIRVFDLRDVLKGLSTHATEKPVIVESIAQYDTKGSRLTCLTAGDGEMVAAAQTVAGEKRKRDENENGSDGADEGDNWPSEVETDGEDKERSKLEEGDDGESD